MKKRSNQFIKHNFMLSPHKVINFEGHGRNRDNDPNFLFFHLDMITV